MGVEDKSKDRDFLFGEEPLPKYVCEIRKLGAKYNVPVQIDITNRIIRFSSKKAFDSDGRNGFVGVIDNIRTNHLDWDIHYL